MQPTLWCACILQMRRISQSDAFLNFIVSLQNLYIRLAQKLSVVLQAAMGQAQKQGRIQTPQQQQQKSTALEGVILDAAANAAGAGKARSEVRGPLNTRAGSAAAVAAQQAVAEQVQSGMGATVGPAG